MMYKTHLAFGLFAGLMFLPNQDIATKLMFLGIVLIGALIPDIDAPQSKLGSRVGILSRIIKLLVGHRTIFHSVFAAALSSGLVWFFVNPTYGTALFVGYASHLVIDCLTKSGINFLHPISNFRISGFITTGGFSENLLLIGIVIVDVWKIVEVFF
ncbi:metal-dependent hydrolase [Candidatus Woesearchaeota archaeon]|nr:metal-dependent hydrolase [Candidatus Woesearchaeota archaeon]